MRISLVIPAIVAVALAAVAGCSIQLEGLAPQGSGGSGGKASVTSAGGAQATATATTTATSTSTGAAQCETKSDCMADSDCVAYECTQGQCVKTNLKEGLPIADLVGNCQKTVCLSGVLTTLADEGDFADDKNPCTIDGCVGETVTHDPGNDSAKCGPPGQHCFGGKCMECGKAADCAVKECSASAKCTSGKCEQLPKGDGAPCALGAGACASGNCCVLGQACGAICCSGLDICNGGVCCPLVNVVCGSVCCPFGEKCTGTGCKP